MLMGVNNNNKMQVELEPVVLLVDGDPAAQELMQRTLAQAGMTVLLCQSLEGSAGATTLLDLREDINVVLLDPSTSGEPSNAALTALHNQLSAAQRGIQLIVIGDTATSEDLAEYLQRDATDFLPKPILRRTLLNAVQEAHRRHLAWCGRYGDVVGRHRAPVPGAELRTLQILAELDECRARSFGGLVELDASWSMLTELLRARLLGRRISVTSLCLASKSPITTALRRIDKLRHAGLLTYVQDPRDGRRKYIDLTAEGAARVQEVVQSIARQLRGESATVRDR